MPTLAIINSVQTLKRYKKVGYTQEQAEEQVEILQEAAEEIFKKIKENTENTKTLTKGKFLYEIEKLRTETKLEIEKLKSNLTGTIIKTVVWTGAGIVIALTSIFLPFIIKN